jgi:glycerophosphoryl diester phosphodiesterase
VTAIWAHRGASSAERENTLAAFRAAAMMGADGIELDVRRTADGALAVHHDAALADGRRLVDLTAADLPPDVPLLDAALDACGDLVVNVEIKNLPGEPDFDPDERLADQVARFVVDEGLHERVLVSSFNLKAINRCLEVDASVPTAFLVMLAPDRDVAGRMVDRARRHGHRALHPHHVGVTPHLVELCRSVGLACNTWTVDEPQRMRELAALGVDAIVTNEPDVAVAALRA